MQLLTNVTAMKWDWQGWLMGIVGAVISGGGNGLAALAIGISWQKTLILVAVSAGISLGKFLQTHSTPDKLQEALSNAADANKQVAAAITEAKAATAPPQP